MDIVNEIKTLIDKRENVWGINNPPPINFPVGFDFTPHLPTFEPQSFQGKDTNECSQLSAINSLATFMNWLKNTGQMTAVSLNWFITNGYIDANGSFAFSEDFTGILDGTSINGNIAQNAWKCFQKYGLLPRSQLNWSLEQAAQYPDQTSMDLAYYSPARITPAMLALAQASKQYFSVSWGWIANGTVDAGLQSLTKGLQTSPLQYVIPVPNPVSDWNTENIVYTGGVNLEHCVMGYAINQTPLEPFPYGIFDQYLPNEKKLEDNYYIPVSIAHFVTMLK